MNDDLFTFNGIDATTGSYLLPRMSAHHIARLAYGEPMEPARSELRYRHERNTRATWGLPDNVNPRNLDETGWGVIFAHDIGSEVRAALCPLLEHRKSQAGPRYREFFGENGYRPQESKSAFLARYRHGPGPADPDRVPYYLLLVGDPASIPYRFQYLLDVQFAVGRIAFDTVEEYARYARSVVQAETNAARVSRRAAFFGVRNAADYATQFSADALVAPLSASLANANDDWQVVLDIGDNATKNQLTNLFGGTETPQLFFSGSHGMGFPNAHPLQRSHQGALLCQDWPGPLQYQGPIKPEFYYSADDVTDDTCLNGMIAFFFACFGAGTPLHDDFFHQSLTHPAPIAPLPFIARLPQRMLSLPEGGALAVIGHVERAWGYSFSWPGVGAHTQVFSASLQRLMGGMPVGHALEYFNEKYAELSTVLSSELEEARFAAQPDELALANMWTALNDARSYVIIGDPAARLGQVA